MCFTITMGEPLNWFDLTLFRFYVLLNWWTSDNLHFVHTKISRLIVYLQTYIHGLHPPTAMATARAETAIDRRYFNMSKNAFHCLLAVSALAVKIAVSRCNSCLYNCHMCAWEKTFSNFKWSLSVWSLTILRNNEFAYAHLTFGDI